MLTWNPNASSYQYWVHVYVSAIWLLYLLITKREGHETIKECAGCTDTAENHMIWNGEVPGSPYDKGKNYFDISFYSGHFGIWIVANTLEKVQKHDHLIWLSCKNLIKKLLKDKLSFTPCLLITFNQIFFRKSYEISKLSYFLKFYASNPMQIRPVSIRISRRVLCLSYGVSWNFRF